MFLFFSIISEDSLIRRPSPFFDMSWNTRGQELFKKDSTNSNQLSVNRLISSRSSSISSMSSSYSHHDPPATSTPDADTQTKQITSIKCSKCGLIACKCKPTLETQTKPPTDFSLLRKRFNEKHRNSIGATSSLNRDVIAQLSRKTSTASDTASATYLASVRHAELLKSARLENKAFSRNLLSKIITKTESNKEISQKQIINSNEFKTSNGNVNDSHKVNRKFVFHPFLDTNFII